MQFTHAQSSSDETFERWLCRLRDRQAKGVIVQRIFALGEGRFGDVKRFDGIGEMRVHLGPGYRIYFTERGDEVVLLLCAGDKDSQVRDIRRAKDMVERLDDD